MQALLTGKAGPASEQRRHIRAGFIKSLLREKECFILAFKNAPVGGKGWIEAWTGAKWEVLEELWKTSPEEETVWGRGGIQQDCGFLGRSYFRLVHVRISLKA